MLRAAVRPAAGAVLAAGPAAHPEAHWPAGAVDRLEADRFRAILALVAHSAARRSSPAPEPVAPTAPGPAARYPAAGPDRRGWGPVAPGRRAAAQVSLLRHPARPAAGHGEYLPAGEAARDRRKWSRSGPAPAAQTGPQRRQTEPQSRSRQWFEAFRAA